MKGLMIRSATWLLTCPGLNPLKSRCVYLSTSTMAKSKFEYTRQFETDDKCLPGCWIVVRVDGKGFHKFSEKHKFAKPNDDRALTLMTKCAEQVLNDFKDIVVGYGQSDEFSFVFKKNTTTYNRRASKLMTTVVSLFSSSYVMHWPEYFKDEKLHYAPSFDSRVVLYPSVKNLKDYLSWRQADCHINNLYNTCFWSLVQEGGLTNRQAQEKLSGTVSAEKNELLFSEFNINYNDLPQIYRKGTVVYKVKHDEESVMEWVDQKTGENREKVARKVTMNVVSSNVDIIGESFWKENPHLIEDS